MSNPAQIKKILKKVARKYESGEYEFVPLDIYNISREQTNLHNVLTAIKQATKEEFTENGDVKRNQKVRLGLLFCDVITHFRKSIGLKPGESLSEWNNSDDRTVENVIEALEKASK